MFPRATVAMAAGADFVVERAVDLVLLSAEDGGEVVGHDGGYWRRAKKRVEELVLCFPTIDRV